METREEYNRKMRMAVLKLILDISSWAAILEKYPDLSEYAKWLEQEQPALPEGMDGAAEKPIKKYEKRFIELLKEMEEELGGNLVAEVRSGEREVMINGLYRERRKEYSFSVKTNNGFVNLYEI